MRFSPRSLLAWIAVAIAGGDPLGHDPSMATSLRDLAHAPAQSPLEQNGPRFS
jgi:hypothetical protein